MIIQSFDNAYSVRTDSLMRIERAQNRIVSCKAGTLLVTKPGFNRDYALREGENLRLGSNNRVLVGGGSDVRLRLAPPKIAFHYSKLIQGEHFANFI